MPQKAMISLDSQACTREPDNGLASRGCGLEGLEPQSAGAGCWM
jgi:hypothetical protein